MKRLLPQIHLRLVLMLLILASTLFAWLGYEASIDRLLDLERVNEATRQTVVASKLKVLESQLEEAQRNLKQSKSLDERLDLTRVVCDLEMDLAACQLSVVGFDCWEERDFWGSNIHVTAPDRPIAEADLLKIISFVDTVGNQSSMTATLRFFKSAISDEMAPRLEQLSRINVLISIE